MEVRQRSLVAILLAALLVVALAAPAAAQPQRNQLLAEIPVTGTLEDGGTFEGVVTITQVALDSAGNLVFSGVLNGIATPAVGDPVEIVNQAFSLVLGALTRDGQGGRCTILTLDLGPIFLDVLGLEVDLSEINLDVTAVSGPGKLLGNLLCAVAGLLDRGGPLSALENLLRNITRLLG